MEVLADSTLQLHGEGGRVSGADANAESQKLSALELQTQICLPSGT
jgi:hypothetical protein